MARRPANGDRRMPVIQLLPNLVTVIAICAGLTAIRLAFQGKFEMAALLIFLAAALDAIDGSLARALKYDGPIGAELDSLADFLNFGVAPPMVLFFWGLQSAGNPGWIAVLVFAVCCVLRLARFNVASRDDDTPSGHFTGVPAPAGGLLVMLPMYLSFAVSSHPGQPPVPVIAWMVFVGLLMISALPTPSVKGIRIDRRHAALGLVIVAALGAALVAYVWETLIVLCVAYLVVIAQFAIRRTRRAARGKA